MLPEDIFVFVLISLSTLIKQRSESLDHHLRVCLVVLQKPWQPSASHEICGAFIGRIQMVFICHTHRFVPNAFLFMTMFCQAEFLLADQQQQCAINVLLVNTRLMHCTQKNEVPGAVFVTALQVLWSNHIPYANISHFSNSTMSRGMCCYWKTGTKLCLQHPSNNNGGKKAPGLTLSIYFWCHCHVIFRAWFTWKHVGSGVLAGAGSSLSPYFVLW